MGFDGLGGGIMVALAAGLWLVYLMPTWFRRSEYLATERNALRLQQTIRVLAETSEVPTVVRVETSTRKVAELERAQREAQRIEDAIERSKRSQTIRIARQRLAAETRGNGPSPSAKLSTARRLRRTRAFVSLLLLAAIITAVVQAGVLIATGGTAGVGAILGFSLVAAVLAVGAQVRLAAFARRRATAPNESAAAHPPRRRTTSGSTAEQTLVEQPAAATWTPVAIPKPLYLSRALAEARRAPESPSGPSGAPADDPVTELREAALASEAALRAAQDSPEVRQISSAPSAAPSRYASMGIVEPTDTRGPDIDAVLRRRRAAS